jgi:hypothetical protein
MDGELRRTEELDSKGNNVLVSVSIIISLLLAAGMLQFPSVLGCARDLSFVYFVGITILMGALGLALTSMKVRRWLIVPNVNNLIQNYSSASFEEVIRRTSGTMTKAVIDMEKKNDMKAKMIDLSWFSVIGGLILVALFILTLVLFTAETCFPA